MNIDQQATNAALPAIIPPTPELVERMELARKGHGVTYEQMLEQTRNSLRQEQRRQEESGEE